MYVGVCVRVERAAVCVRACAPTLRDASYDPVMKPAGMKLTQDQECSSDVPLSCAPRLLWKNELCENTQLSLKYTHEERAGGEIRNFARA